MDQEIFKNQILALGASDVGFFQDEGANMPFSHGITIVLRLSDAIIEEITDSPTHTYFNHYRSINAMIDGLLLRTGLLLQQQGYSYITVASSQSINIGDQTFQGRYSHKKGGVLSGLGTIGKNALFLHKKWGPRVRLGTIFTNAPLQAGTVLEKDLCSSCMRCVLACPAMALSGQKGEDGHMQIDRQACSSHMKKAYQKIGRGAVCGICMAQCPVGKWQKHQE